MDDPGRPSAARNNGPPKLERPWAGCCSTPRTSASPDGSQRRRPPGLEVTQHVAARWRLRPTPPASVRNITRTSASSWNSTTLWVRISSSGSLRRRWREREIISEKSALEYLRKYRWSSFPDYMGKKNFPSILTADLFQDTCNEKAVMSYLHDIQTSPIRPYLLE